MNKVTRVLVVALLLTKYTDSLADSIQLSAQPSRPHTKGPVGERAKEEEKIPPNYFALTLYKPTYFIPYYYTGSPYDAVYQNNTPNNERLKNAEVKFQFSFKVPIWQRILKSHSSLFAAYTQRSYWQAYNHSAFFRESDYEPELFLSNEINLSFTPYAHFNFLNIGISHQSNGYGGALERSWNRAYAEATFSTGHFMLNLKPWYILSKNGNNRDISQYLGHGQILVGYKYGEHVVSLTTWNILERGGKRTSAELSWSFPLTKHLKGYIQAFHGYGQSLIEYNHRTNSAGIGIAFSDWV